MPERRATSAEEIRRRAEERARDPRLGGRGPDEARLLHDLEVHQIELELQNEELQATRAEAERTAARFAEIYEFAPVGYATLGGDGAIRGINLAGARLLGLERARLVGGNLRALLQPPHLDEFQRFVVRAFGCQIGDRAVCELAAGLGPGRRFLRLTGCPLPEGRELLLALEDITDRKEGEEELHEALRVLHASQRTARLGTFVMDARSGRWESSEALDELLGLGPGFQRTAEGLLGLVHQDDRAALAGHLAAARVRGDRVDHRCRVVRPGGEVRVTSIAATAEYDGLEPVRLVGTVQDVTEQQRLLEERSELARAAEEARGRAEAADRAKDAFLATLSHELRNPLAPIGNGLVVLERAPPGSEQARRAIAVMHRQVRHLSRLVDDLLDVTRITRGKVQLKTRRLDLNELVRTVVEDHRALFDANGVRLELSAAATPVHVEGDWDRLAQVVGNLLTNAAKFCRRGELTRVSVGVEGAGPRAQVAVSDEGAGMEPAMLARLFQPFSQADATLDRSKGGLGLGMALAKGLVELHRGSIEARSAGIGRGSEFVFRLPLATGVAPGAERAPRPSRTVAPRRVLLIEDNADAADTLREVLALGGHDVSVAYSGPEGLAKARAFKPDIVLCDVGLPGMDGYEVARALRADPSLRGAYLVALTGYAQPEDERRALASGFDRHLAKPSGREQLEQAFAEAAHP